MKKLSLKSLNLGSNELLQREQLRTVFGGYECDEGVTIYCNNGDSWEATSCDRVIAEQACSDGGGPNRCA